MPRQFICYQSNNTMIECPAEIREAELALARAGVESVPVYVDIGCDQYQIGYEICARVD
jgi:hypothetical protein